MHRISYTFQSKKKKKSKLEKKKKHEYIYYQNLLKQKKKIHRNLKKKKRKRKKEEKIPLCLTQLAQQGQPSKPDVLSLSITLSLSLSLSLRSLVISPIAFCEMWYEAGSFMICMSVSLLTAWLYVLRTRCRNCNRHQQRLRSKLRKRES